MRCKCTERLKRDLFRNRGIRFIKAGAVGTQALWLTAVNHHIAGRK